MTMTFTIFITLTYLILSLNLNLTSAMSSQTSKRVAVIGATGRLGRITVQKLSSKGIPCKILIRHDISSQDLPEDLESAQSSSQVAAYLTSLPYVESVQGDVTNKESLVELVKDTSAVLAVFGANRKSKLTDALPWSKCEDDPTHAKQVNYEGVRNIIEACRSPGSTCNRIVRITGKGEDPWNFFSILINLLGSMAKAWNNEGERLLRECKDLDYTIVRPGVMGRPNPPEGKVLALADNGGSLPVSPISHATVADLCIESLDYPNAARSTLCAMTVEPGSGEGTYAPLLAKIKPDARKFEPMLDSHRQAVRTVAFALLAVSFALTSRAVLSLLSFL